MFEKHKKCLDSYAEEKKDYLTKMDDYEDLKRQLQFQEEIKNAKKKQLEEQLRTMQIAEVPAYAQSTVYNQQS